MDDLIAEFLTETNESLEELDADLIKLEQNPNDSDLLSKIFRLMHTIKGTCGFLGLPRLETVAHHAENVLGLFRDGVLEVTPEYVTLILESIDRIKLIVGGIEETGGEPSGDDRELIAKLDKVYESSGKGDDANLSEEELEKAVQEAIEQTANDAPAEVAEPELEPEQAQEEKAEESAVPRESSVAAQSLRVNVDVLENLMTMVSELVLTRNQLLQILRSQSESGFSAPLQRLNHVVSDLQDGVMKTRMQPIGNAWAKLPRIIRDISLDLGKKIELEMHGQDTELDRQVLDLIKDPLTHMVRNSADHGIEAPADRAAAGKPETGKIVLNAYHEGGHIIIEITDDGKGLPTEKIKAKILERGLATADELETMPLQQIQQFIFDPGFSTANKVTSVSGRGVGMDVVRSNIEKIGGSIELKSIEGKGSKFLIKIPLTLAIVSALIVESGGERYAIPQLAVRELVKASYQGENSIEMIKGTPVYRLRDHLLPLVSLRDTLENTLTGNDADSQYIVVTQVGAYLFGIIVDRVFDTEEIVVKPVATILKNIDIFSGNTILGDGSVIMILDPSGIAKAGGEISHSDTMDVTEEERAAAEGSGAEKTTLLLFEAGKTAPKAVPLSLVSRIENIKKRDVEYSDGKMMVQYRGKLMPLVPFDAGVSFDTTEEKPVLVFADEEKSMGMIVDSIIDIVDEHVDVQISSGTKSLLGSAIINDKATDVVDVGHYLRNVDHNWYGDHGGQPYTSSGDANGNGALKKRVLLIDDSPFFRNMLTPLLRVAGYEVTSLESPLEALKICEDGACFDVIISDIEMPEMDGFELAERLRANTSWQNTPMLALSSHATPKDIERGREAGFLQHVAKFDRDTLLTTLSNTLAENGEAL